MTPSPGFKKEVPPWLVFLLWTLFMLQRKQEKKKKGNFLKGFPNNLFRIFPPSGTSFYSHIFPLRYSFIFYLIPI